MRNLEAALPGGRRLLALDAALAAWAVVWLVVAIVIATEVRDLGELSDTVGAVGGAAESAGGALGLVGELPVIGGPVGGALDVPAEEIREAGALAQETAETSRKSVNALSVMLGLTIALLPTLPILAIYVPARRARAEEARIVRDAVNRTGNDPALQDFLARRAVHNLSLRALQREAEEPWRDLAAGRHDRLARAELRRLGL